RYCVNLWRLTWQEHQFNWAAPSIIAMKQALSLPIGIEVSDDPIPVQKDEPLVLEFRHVDYVYPRDQRCKNSGKEMEVLRDINFTVNPGDKVALLGPSGAGKTTIMRLGLRFMDPIKMSDPMSPDSGDIYLNGRRLAEYDLTSWLRDTCGYIPQVPQILDGTIAYNLLYSFSREIAENFPEEEIWRYMRLLKIDFGERLTDGIYTVVGTRGIRLSGGQCQRVAIGAAV
ncbi:MAG: ATP-binding cassette domain-containing protein, partial [Candidatus Paceibacterota bacterium]